MKERANAKINLCLDVVGKRESDGYHELKMIMVPIDFYDVLEMVPAGETTLSLNRSYLPINDKNTIIKAINVMKAKYGFDTNFACILHKHIPTRAGYTFNNWTVSGTGSTLMDSTLKIGTGTNVINIYYTKRNDLSYKVNYLV